MVWAKIKNVSLFSFTIISKLFFAPAGDTILCITNGSSWPTSGTQKLSTGYKEHRGRVNCFNFPLDLSLSVSRTKRDACCDTFMVLRAMLLMLICNTLLEIVQSVVRLRLWNAVRGLVQFLDYFWLSWFNTLREGKYIHFGNDFFKFISIKNPFILDHAFL